MFFKYCLLFPCFILIILTPFTGIFVDSYDKRVYKEEIEVLKKEINLLKQESIELNNFNSKASLLKRDLKIKEARSLLLTFKKIEELPESKNIYDTCMKDFHKGFKSKVSLISYCKETVRSFHGYPKNLEEVVHVATRTLSTE